MDIQDFLVRIFTQVADSAEGKSKVNKRKSLLRIKLKIILKSTDDEVENQKLVEREPVGDLNTYRTFSTQTIRTLQKETFVQSKNYDHSLTLQVWI